VETKNEPVPFSDRFPTHIYLHGNEYQGSDFHKWHAQLYVEAKPPTIEDLTRSDPGLQLLGSGWIVVPDNPE
jgi:hypothetical protein